MKQILYIMLLFSLMSCQDKIGPNFNTYALKLQLLIPEKARTEIDNLTGIDILITNKFKDYYFVKRTDSTGYLYIDNLESGIYSLNISAPFPEEGVTTILNGAREILITENTNDSLELSVVFVQDEGTGFVIREYYYSGSTRTNEKSYFSDQFIEIYNNSGDTLMADSLLVVELESDGRATDYWTYMHDDSIVVKTIWALPSHNYPIAPGEGFIIAQDAMKHKSDSTYGNSNSPVDLNHADFEFWSDKSANGDIDYPAPNMVAKLWVWKGNEFVFHSRGGSAIALVKIPGDVDEYINHNYISKESTTSTARYYCKIPNKWVVDAVEATWNDRLYKRLGNSLDAGSTYITPGPYFGLSVRRAIERTIDDRTVYKDTNNSSVDFLKDQIPQPGIYE